MFARRLLASTAGRAAIETDVLVVGGGPAGLSTAIRLKRLDSSTQVMLLEKGAQIVFDPKALSELYPEWRGGFAADRPPIDTEATEDRMYLLTKHTRLWLPVPSVMSNHGNYIISLSDLTRWLGRRAEEAQVEVYPGFGGAQLSFDGTGRVNGVITNDVGIGKDGQRRASYEPGMEIRAKVTVLAEGAHGSLTKIAKQRFDLQRGQEQTYGLGIKEVWEVPAERHQRGLVIHSVGYPLDRNTYGGAFAYHYDQQRVSIGLVVGLDYRNPYLNPYQEFQQLKRHPMFAEMLEGGKCIAYGGRVINEGGTQCMPRLSFPGGLLVGCSAGFVNVPKIKGSHYAMKSGILAAEAIHECLRGGKALEAYEDAVQTSWIWEELHAVRNLRPSFQKLGLYGGLLYSGIDAMLFKGRLPWTLRFAAADHESLKPASACRAIDYPKPDNILTFDLMTSVSRTGTNHEEDQPSHLQLARAHDPRNATTYAEVESRFCPAGVYEYVQDAGDARKLQINAQNCIHCKTCDIKDPSQNINWTVPEGGGGPNYSGT